MSSGLVAGAVFNAACDGLGDGCLDGVGDVPAGTLSGCGVLEDIVVQTQEGGTGRRVAAEFDCVLPDSSV